MNGIPLAVKAVAFDLDGTLLDTAADIASAANRMLEEMGLCTLPPQVIESYIGNGISILVQRTLETSRGHAPDADFAAGALRIFERQYMEVLVEQTQLYDGVMEGLRELRGMGLMLACVTNKVEKFTFPLLRQLGLLDFFTLVLSGDSLPRKKPDPAPLLHTCDYFGIRPQHLLMVGDSANDTQAARAAGCPVFCVPYGYTQGRDIADEDHDALILHVGEIARLVAPAA